MHLVSWLIFQRKGNKGTKDSINKKIVLAKYFQIRFNRSNKSAQASRFFQLPCSILFRGSYRCKFFVLPNNFLTSVCKIILKIFLKKILVLSCSDQLKKWHGSITSQLQLKTFSFKINFQTEFSCLNISYNSKKKKKKKSPEVLCFLFHHRCFFFLGDTYCSEIFHKDKVARSLWW